MVVMLPDAWVKHSFEGHLVEAVVESDTVVPTAVLPWVHAHYRGDGVTFEKCCGTTAVAVADSDGIGMGMNLMGFPR